MYQKAVIDVEMGSGIDVMFNPSEYSLDTSVNYNSVKVPGMNGPITQYVSGEQDTLTIQLMFNTYLPPRYDSNLKTIVEVNQSEMADVANFTSKIYNLTKMNPLLHRPPICTFKWGSLQFRGVVTDVKQKFTMFLDNGKPVRALVDITFKSVLDPLLSQKQSPFSLSDGGQLKMVVMDASTSLMQISSNIYKNADNWKKIAKANGITNPLKVKPGTKLKIPK